MLSGPAKNFQFGVTDMPSFATCTTDNPTISVSITIPFKTTTNSFGLFSAVFCVASIRPPYNPCPPLDTVWIPTASATDVCSGLLPSEIPTSSSTRVPGRGAPPASFESSIITTKPHDGAAMLIEVTDTKKKFCTITSSKYVASIPSTTMLPSGSRNATSEAFAMPRALWHAAVCVAIRFPRLVLNPPFLAAT